MKDILKWVMYGAVFAVPFVLLYVSSSMFFPYITGKNFAFRILVEVAVAAWVLLALVDKSYRPRFSWILVAISSLVMVMFVANIFGEYPLKSFWSNFERMEGWVTLVHFLLYFVVLGSVLKTEKLWNWFLNTALVAAVIMSFYALAQVAGVIDISQGGNWRVDARLGNSSYLGVYMLFNMFIAAWMFLRAKTTSRKLVYTALFVMFGYILFNTGTRGAVLGLIGGSVLAFSYLALMAPKGAAIKKWALGGMISVILVAGGLWTLRDTAMIQNSQLLSRFADISLSEGNIRFMVWQMAYEGVKEHPILGWGQENFNYVFNKYYDPGLHGAESWYDRTHNIFFDWLIAGGVLGLLAYLSILVMALWYAVVIPGWARLQGKGDNEQYFTVNEQALIFGLLAAYTFHNLFVFDNLASWIFYAVVLALIHSRISREIEMVEKFSIDKGIWERIAVPVVLVVAAFGIYSINIPGIKTAQDIIDSYLATSVAEKLNIFERAYERDSFANQEVAEQLIQTSSQIFNKKGVTNEEKNQIIATVEKIFFDLIEKKPGDARLHVLLGSFYRATGNVDEALAQYEIALDLSPHKQAIIEEIGLIYMLSDHREEAVAEFQKSYELDERNIAGKVRLAAAWLYAGNEEEYIELVGEDKLTKDEGLNYTFINSQMMLQVANTLRRYDILEYIFKGLALQYPSESTYRVNLAAAYYEQGDKEATIEVIKEAMRDIPSFQDEGEKLLAGIEAGQNE